MTLFWMNDIGLYGGLMLHVVSNAIEVEYSLKRDAILMGCNMMLFPCLMASILLDLAPFHCCFVENWGLSCCFMILLFDLHRIDFTTLRALLYASRFMSVGLRLYFL